MSLVRSTLIFTLTWCLGGVSLVAAADKPDVDEQSAKVLKAFAAQFQQLKTLRVNIDSATTVEQQGVKNTFRNTFQLAIERPNRVAARVTHGSQALTTVCDGRRSFIELPALRRYTVGSASASIDEVMGDGPQRMINLQHGLLFVTTLFAGSDPYQSYLEDLEGAKYLGVSEADGQKCHRIRLDVKPMTWDLWLDLEDRPLLRQASPDLAALFAQQSGGELPPGLKLSTAITYKSWDLDAKLDAKEFAIEPTAGFDRVETLFGREQQEDVHELVGAPAPPLKLDLLAGGHVDLASLKGKVVILDFWATWCGPCVRALPTIAAVAKKYEPKGVAFYAVNLQEQPGDVTEFLKEHQLTISVALDRTGKAAQAYGAEAIPQTVLIGKDGRVQVVHVGAAPDLKDRLTKELDALVDDQDLAGAALKGQAIEAVGVAGAWTLSGKFDAVAGDGRGSLLAISGRIAQPVDAKGKSDDAFALASPGKALRLFRAQAGQTADLLIFSMWDRSLAAQRSGGDLLWVHDAADGLDDVTTVDFDGDGRDEVVVGFNGGGGVLALDAAGKELWRFKEIGNVWHVAAGDVQGDTAPEVITSSAEGQVYVFDRAGKRLAKLDPHCYASHVGVFRRGKGDGADKGLILAAGAAPGDDGEVLVAVGLDAQAVWTLPLDDKNDAIEAVTISASRPWAAVSTNKGRVHVVDLAAGKFIARLSAGKSLPAAWLDRADDAPLLVVNTGRKLEAFAVSGK